MDRTYNLNIMSYEIWISISQTLPPVFCNICYHTIDNNTLAALFITHARTGLLQKARKWFRFRFPIKLAGVSLWILFLPYICSKQTPRQLFAAQFSFLTFLATETLKMDITVAVTVFMLIQVLISSIFLDFVDAGISLARNIMNGDGLHLYFDTPSNTYKITHRHTWWMDWERLYTGELKQKSLQSGGQPREYSFLFSCNRKELQATHDIMGGNDHGWTPIIFCGKIKTWIGTVYVLIFDVKILYLVNFTPHGLREAALQLNDRDIIYKNMVFLMKLCLRAYFNGHYLAPLDKKYLGFADTEKGERIPGAGGLDKVLIIVKNVGLPSSSPETLHDIMNNIVPVMDSMVSSQDLLNTKLNEILRMYQIPEMPLEGKYSYTEYAEYTNTFVEYLGTHYYETYTRRPYPGSLGLEVASSTPQPTPTLKRTRRHSEPSPAVAGPAKKPKNRRLSWLI